MKPISSMAQLKKLRMIGGVNLIVAVRKQWALKSANARPGALLFNSRILLRDLMPRLEGFRPRLARR